jgi:hypothetical protein
MRGSDSSDSDPTYEPASAKELIELAATTLVRGRAHPSQIERTDLTFTSIAMSSLAIAKLIHDQVNG